MLIKEIDESNVDLSYEIFIDKSINLLEKVFIIIKQYNEIRNNNYTLTCEIKKVIKLSTKVYIFKDINNNIEIDINSGEELMKKLMNKLFMLNTCLNNYIKDFRNDMHNTYLNIQEIYKELKYDISEITICYEKESKEFDKLFSSIKYIEINNNTDDIFEHINNISNNYKLTTRIILYTHTMLFLGELLKMQNTTLKKLYNEMLQLNMFSKK